VRPVDFSLVSYFPRQFQVFGLITLHSKAVFLKLFYSIAPFSLSTRRFRPPSSN